MARTYKRYTVRKRGGSWQAILSRKVTGAKRVMVSRATKAEAEAEAERKLLEIEASAGKCIELTKPEWEACGLAIQALKDKGFTGTQIIDAATLFIAQNHSGRRRRAVSDVIRDFMTSRRGSGAAPMTIRGYQWKLDPFAKDFGGRFIDDIAPSEIESWMDTKNISGGNRADYRRRISILFRYAIANNWATNNAGAAISKVTRKKTRPAIMDPQEIRTLLMAAKDYAQGACLPFFALGAFCGLRPWEIRRTSWSDVKLDKKQLYVTPDACKTKEDRIVDIPDCCIAWLSLTPEEARKGTIYFTQTQFKAVIRKAGLQARWQPDILRHTAASHLYAKTQNSTYVTAQMGHSLGVFMTYYRATVEPTQATEYYAILPDQPAADASQDDQPAAHT